MEPGKRVTEQVELVRRIGSGAMGTVWEAVNLALDTQVAVKFLSREIVDADPSVFARFKREASIAAKIRSPHAVQIFEYGVLDEEQPYIVMELLAGESLEARIAQAPLPIAQTATVVAQTAEVLGRAHRLGIVHRDIKPENLFLIDSGYDVFIKVLDFGIAKQTAGPNMSSMTQTGALMGTPYYMSPELIQSAKGATPLADLWALAVVAYQALTGAVPFDAETVGGVLVAIAAGAFEPPSTFAPHLPPELDAWFARALNPDPDVRFATAEEMALAFSEVTGAPPRTSQVSLPSWDAAPTATLRSAPSMPRPPLASVGTLAATEMKSERLPQTTERRVGRVAVAGIVALALAGAAIVALVFTSGDGGLPAARVAPATNEIAPASSEPRVDASSTPRAAVTMPSASARAPARVAPATTSVPAPKRATPAKVPKPTRTKRQTTPPNNDSCMAFDAKRNKWVYTCK